MLILALASYTASYHFTCFQLLFSSFQSSSRLLADWVPVPQYINSAGTCNGHSMATLVQVKGKHVHSELHFQHDSDC